MLLEGDQPPREPQQSVMFAGLETPPVTLENDLDKRLERLVVKELHPTTTPPSAAQRPPSPEPALAVTGVYSGPQRPPSPAHQGSSANTLAGGVTASAEAGLPAAEEIEGTEGECAVPPAEFRFFPLLPAELRIRIWELSLEPRVVELHTRRLHYADNFRHGGHIHWHSQCANPAALSVSPEAREVALKRYAVAVPLAVALQGYRREFAGDSVADLEHRLYLDPAADTVALLGELDLSLLRTLLEVVRAADPTGRGLRRLGLSAACFKHQGGGPTLSMYARTVFRDLDELVLFMYAMRMPPERWSQGLCVLQDCSDKDFYRRWEMTVGKQLKRPDGKWTTVGRENREIRIMDLLFLPRKSEGGGD